MSDNKFSVKTQSIHGMNPYQENATYERQFKTNSSQYIPVI